MFLKASRKFPFGSKGPTEVDETNGASKSAIAAEKKEIERYLGYLADGIPWMTKLQKNGVRYMLEKRRGRVLCADEMGVGKTLQALAAMNFYRHEWPVLLKTLQII